MKSITSTLLLAILVVFGLGGLGGGGVGCGGNKTNTSDTKATNEDLEKQIQDLSDQMAAQASVLDGVKNGDETDIDCGGSNPSKCNLEKSCVVSNDCSTDNCQDLKCAPPPSAVQGEACTLSGTNNSHNTDSCPQEEHCTVPAAAQDPSQPTWSGTCVALVDGKDFCNSNAACVSYHKAEGWTCDEDRICQAPAAPKLILTHPLGDRVAAAGELIWLHFSKPMDLASVQSHLKVTQALPTKVSVSGKVTADDVKYTAKDGTFFTFTPASPLITANEDFRTYHLSIEGAKDTTGLPLDKGYDWWFCIGLHCPPNEEWSAAKEVDVGEKCVTNSDCISVNCYSGVCEPPNGTFGAPCSADDDCISGNCQLPQIALQARCVFPRIQKK